MKMVKKMKKLTVVFCSSPDYSNNAKSLYNYMKEHYREKMDLAWVIKDKQIYNSLNQVTHCVLEGTLEYKKLMEEADIFFTTHANLIHERKKHQIYIELWHGISIKKLGFLIQNLRKNDYEWTTFISRNVDYFIVPSDFWVPIFCSFFHINPERVLPCGFPLIRDIVNSNGKQNLEVLLNKKLNGYRKIIYYMPTYRKCQNEPTETKVNLKNIFNFEEYDEKIVLNYLKKNKILLCVKRHPTEALEYKIVNHPNVIYINQTMMDKTHLNTNDILNAGDLLITDYSSLGLEFLPLKKPVLYLDGDVEDYLSRRGILFSNFNFWTNNETANNVDLLIHKLDELLNKKYDSHKLKNQISLFYNKNILVDGGCKAICDFFFLENQLAPQVHHYVSIEQNLDEENKRLKLQQKEDQSMIEVRTKEVYEKQHEIDQILNSTSWKIITRVRNFKKYIFFWKHKK